MKYIPVPVYSYDELSEEAQYNAQEEWTKTKHKNDLVPEWPKFIEEMKNYGLIIDDWDFEDYEKDFHIKISYKKRDAEGLSAFKKLLKLYSEITLTPKVYKSKNKQRISKIQQVKIKGWEYPNWIKSEFVEYLKSLINKKDLNNTLSNSLNTVMRELAISVRHQLITAIEGFPDEAEEKGFLFFENGSRYYEDKEN